MKSVHGLAGALFALAIGFSGGVQAQNSAEVLHWWTSGGEAAALKVLVAAFEKTGNTWKDNPVAGGEAARMVARTRILGGDPPTSMQYQIGRPLQILADDGLLNDVDEIAAGWDKVLPKEIADRSKYKGKYVTAPLTIHGHNWLWANKAVLDEAGIAMPKSWSELVAAGDTLKAKGIIPLALGGVGWQEIFVFESIILDVGGRDLLRKVTYEFDDATLRGPQMVEVFKTFAKVRDLVDAGSPGRDWNITASMMIGGKAAFMIMGDWIKGEFTAAKKVPGQDIACEVFPAGKDTLIFGTDAFAMTAVKDKGTRAAQLALAMTVMDPQVQRAFSLIKGSIPTRTDVDKSGFDACAQIAMKESADGHLFLVGDNVADATSFGAMQDTMTAFLHSKETPEEGAKTMAAAIAATK